MLRIGHKGADAIVPGNTIASFRAAVDAGVDAIEFDVLRPRSDFADGTDWRSASAGPAHGTGPIVVAHDWQAAKRGDVPTLEEALDAFCKPPLDHVLIDLDIKICGREDEIANAVAARGLTDRVMTSGTELPTIRELARTAPELSRGWTLPRVKRDWTAVPLLKPAVLAGMGVLRARLPRIVTRDAPALGVKAIWIHHALATPALADAVQAQGMKLMCWTVDDVARMRELRDLGADGICSNDPRLFDSLDR